MNDFNLIFELPNGLLIACLLLGITYGGFLYFRNKGPWNARINISLLIIRSILVFVISAFLLIPFIKYINNVYEDPILVLAVDNSKSIILVEDSVAVKNSANKLKNDFLDINSGYSIEVLDVEGAKIDRMDFKGEETDLYKLLKTIQMSYQGKNLKEVVILSDGIYNMGISPVFADFNFKINTIGWGDTIAKKDVKIEKLRYNKVSYQGNKFPIMAEVVSNGYENISANVSLFKNGKVLETKTISLTNNSFQEVEFYGRALQSGLQRYTVVVENLDDEFNSKNNSQTAIIDIISGKENILIAAKSVNPDIKAIKSVIDKNPNYQVDLLIGDYIKPDSIRKYDLVVLHNLSKTNPIFKNLDLNFDNTPVLIIDLNTAGVTSFNSENSILNINIRSAQDDLILPNYNTAFGPFELSQGLIDLINDLPPVTVPFGSYTSLPGSEILLFQRVGSVDTGKPLMIFGTESPRTGVFVGRGLWRWRLHDFQQNGDNKLFEEYISKSVQYLSAKEDKRKFKVYPINNSLGNSAILETEVYNDLYERIYGNDITIKVTDENGTTSEHSFTTSQENSKYELKNLNQGVFKFNATTSLNGVLSTSAGEFVVRENNKESSNLKADFNLLRRLAIKHGGSFYPLSNYSELLKKYEDNTPEAKIHSSELYTSLLNIPLMLVFLIVLISAEWFIRKYSGGY